MAIPRHLWLLLTCLLAAALFRWHVGIPGSLWLDEAWSVLIARGCNGDPRAVFADPNLVDNNHPLLTLLIVLIGPWRDGWIYRTPLWATSTLLPLLAYLLSQSLHPNRASKAPHVHAGLFPPSTPFPSPKAPHVYAGLFPPHLTLPLLWASTSFSLTLYGTEARGYGLAITAALAAWYLSNLPLTRTRLIAYASICTLGTLAHFSFTQALAGIILAQLLSSNRSPRDLLVRHGFPLAFALLFFLTFVSRLKIAGAGGLPDPTHPLQSLAESALGAASLSLLGAPWSGPFVWAIGLPILLLSLLTAWSARHRGGYVVLGAWASALIMILAKSLLYRQGEVVFPRYFLIPATLSTLFLLIELSRRLAHLPRPSLRPPLTLALLALILLPNLWQTLAFSRHDARGETIAPLQVIASSPEPTLSSDYDSRTLRIENFARPWLPTKIEYLRADSPQPPPTPPRWHLAGTGFPVPSEPRITLHGTPYLLRQTYPHHGPSGWTWLLYERE